MRSMKTSDGLTRGQGMTEQQQFIWLLSMPTCAEVNRSMLELTGVSYSTSEQNKDMTKARQDHDWKDTQTLVKYLHERTPSVLMSVCAASPLEYMLAPQLMLTQRNM